MPLKSVYCRILIPFFCGFFLACSKTPDLSRVSLLRLQLPYEPVTLDPSLAEDGVSLEILNNIAEGLFGYDGEGHLEKRLAESFHISSDGMKYEFTLRQNAQWSDGRPIQAQDFVLAFQRMMGPHTVSILAPLFFSIRGARSYHEGKQSAAQMRVFVKNGKFILELERPMPYLLQALTLPVALPIRSDILSSNHGRWPETAPVTGPYKISSHLIDQKINLERNLNYWRQDLNGKVPISKIELWIISDESTGLNLFKQGELDVLTRVPSLDFEKMKKTGRILTSPFLATYYLSFDCRKPPFKDRLWRRAIAGSIRRDEIAQMLGTGEIPAFGWIPKGLEGYIPYQNPRPVFEDAVLKIKEQGRLTQPFSVGFDSGSRNSRILEKVQQDLFQTLGLNVTLDPLDWKSYLKKMRTDPYPLFRFAWMAPFQDPISHLKAFMTHDINNLSGCSNLKYDLLVGEIEKMSPGVVREHKIRMAQKILLEEEVSLVPLYHYVLNTAVSPRVHGIRVNPFGVIQLRELELKESH